MAFKEKVHVYQLSVITTSETELLHIYKEMELTGVKRKFREALESKQNKLWKRRVKIMRK